MFKKFRKTMIIIMLVCLVFNSVFTVVLAEDAEPQADSVIDVIVTIPEAAAGVEESTVDVETTPGVTEEIPVQEVTEVESSTEDALEGSTETQNVHIESSATDVFTESGMIVDYEGSFDATIETTTDADGNVIDSNITDIQGSEDYLSVNKRGTYVAEGGSEIIGGIEDGQETMDDTTVEIPMEEGASNSVAGKPAGTVVGTTADPTVSEGEGSYDYTNTIIVNPGSMTVETNEISYKETVIAESDTLEHVKSETEAGNTNELFDWNFRNSYLGKVDKQGNVTEGYIHLLEKIENDIANGTDTAGIEAKDGYAFVYIGGDNTSQYMPTFLFKSPSADNPDQEPIVINGENYYLRDYGGTGINTRYDENGNEIAIEEGDAAQIFSVPQQFLLYDPANKQLATVYCADFDTETVNNFNYNIVNVEDATYYSDEEAAMIRAIASNGYWGTSNEQKEDGSYEVGSLAAMKEKLWSSGKFGTTEEERATFDALLTDGVAMTATQMAIWTYSNKMSDIEFLNVMSSKNPSTQKDAYGNEVDGIISSSWASGLGVANKDEKSASYDLLYKVYNYLVNLDPQMANNDPENPVKTSANTIINKDNFIKGMNVTVIEMDKNHENNKDENKDNDAYLGTLTFALEVKPVGEDMFEVKVLGPDGSEHKGIIVSKDKEASFEGALKSDENGNYSFPEIVLVEGDQEFNITLEGIQHLQEGVYLYTSEISEEGESSQTLVGMAGGDHAVNVSMTIEFGINVEEQMVVTERVWRTERTASRRRTPGGSTIRNSDPGTTLIEDEGVPLSDGLETILDEEVPLAAVPQTGDNSVMYLLVSLLSLCGIILLAKKRRVA